MDQPPVTDPEPGAGQAELRAAPRFALMMRAVKLITPSGEFLCIMRDASETGVKAKLFHALPKSERYQLELGNGARHEVDLVWQDNGHAGFRFTAGPVDVRELVEEHGDLPRRQLRLKMVRPLSVIVTAGGTAQVGQVQDIAQNGGAVRLETMLALRQAVEIEASGIGRVAGRVRWRRGSVHGIVFQQGFAMDQLAVLVARLNLGAEGNDSAVARRAGNPHPR
ncbi:PilZ domain-containing protein [Novosphingobium sp.]|uniref:PilZ domain-containing protein n=1 Tax=Novosphingobium sp. TaxID=1874826 RepID=UPI0035ADB599